MPTQTFLNLPEEKRQKIFMAIYQELKRVPFPEISINKIVKNAGISRGSFYQYFENKDDAFDYFVKESSEIVKRKVVDRISTKHGDFFELTEIVFDEIIKAGEDKDWTEIISHTVPYANLDSLEPISHYIENMEERERVRVLSSLGIAEFDIKSEQELMDLIGLIESLYQNALPQIFIDSANRKEIREKFRRRLNIIKRAMLKEGV